QLVRWRENSRYCRSELFGFSKNIFRALGDHFASSGVLRRADDIYHLTQDEVFGYVDGTGVTENLQALADLRRSEFEQNQAVETPMELTTLGPVRANQLASRPRPEESSGELRGLGSSTGKVRGRARVVLDPNCAEELGKDTILIARETDPGWLFLMLASKGIVVERGSMLSHTAITGRKFGIPTIVSLAGATTRIPDGAWIEMDGASGVVTVLPDGG
ncbi:MAG: PEP-utilizing enzyme, partial [Myxococcales bacterium]